LNRVPALARLDEIVFDLIHNEFLLREERGEDPRPDEYLNRFPRFRDRLEAIFAFRAHPTRDPPPATVTLPPAPTGNQPLRPGRPGPRRPRPRRGTTPTAAGSPAGTSSRPTSPTRQTAGRSSPTSGWRGGTGTTATAPAAPARPPT